MIAAPSLRVARRGLFAVGMALLLPESVRAGTPDQENAWSLTRRQGMDEARVTDQKFSSTFEMLYGGPQWLLDVLPGSTSTVLARTRATTFVFDSSGDRVEPTAAYTEPLREVF